MIGVFDSGFGGLCSLQHFREELPEYNFLYLGDSAHAPYGDKNPRWIRQRSFECLHWMFAQGCDMVIMACNTATTVAIRAWQATYPEQKALSVTIPGVEQVMELGLRHVGVLATRVTVETGLYKGTFDRRHYHIETENVVGDGLVEAIESGAQPHELQQQVSALINQFSMNIEGLVLGCTHYPLLQSEIEYALKADIPIINPALHAAHKLHPYLEKHTDIEQSLSKGGLVQYYTTGEKRKFDEIGGRILGERIQSLQIVI